MKRLYISLGLLMILSSIGIGQETDDSLLLKDMKRERESMNQFKEKKKKEKIWVDDGFETLISRDKKVSHGVYAGLELGYASIDSRSALLTGFNIAWVIDHSIELGFATKGFITNPLPDINIDNKNYIYTGGYGGFYFAGTVISKKVVNVSFPVTLGGGGLSYIQSFSGNYYYHPNFDHENQPHFYPEYNYLFFLVEPGVDIQLNVTRFFRVSLGASYRLTSDSYLIFSNVPDLPVNSTFALSGFNASMKFKFGKF